MLRKNEISYRGCWKFLERSSETNGREIEFTVRYLFIPGPMSYIFTISVWRSRSRTGDGSLLISVHAWPELHFRDARLKKCSVITVSKRLSEPRPLISDAERHDVIHQRHTHLHFRCTHFCCMYYVQHLLCIAENTMTYKNKHHYF